MSKVNNTVFPLATSTTRIALITGIVGGTVTPAEVVEAVAHDLKRRAHKKPVVAEGKRFDSITDAARFIVTQRQPKAKQDDFFRAMQSEVKRIARWCTDDCWEGYYWSE